MWTHSTEAIAATLCLRHIERPVRPKRQAARVVQVRVRQVCAVGEGDEAAAYIAAVQRRLHESGVRSEEDVAHPSQLNGRPKWGPLGADARDETDAAA